MKDRGLIKLASSAARRLIEVARPEQGGIKWAMTPSFRRLMPNFSHGTAGVAYFLATLYLETKEKIFLDHALAGAKYLKAVAHTEGDVCLVFHNEPDGKNLYYLGWCHGPTGTARLFYQRHRATGDGEWMQWVRRSARGVMTSGIPEKRTPGFWNNVSQCCGSAGVAEFFLALHRATREKEFFIFAKRVADDLLARATREGNGSKWVQSEHRVRPELLVAQTGYMQGAAGIGILLLHLDAEMKGKRPSIIFPDSPF
jgi:lantibiotic modifying enzyme